MLWYQSGRASGGTDDPEGCWLPDGEVAEVRTIADAAGLRLIHDVYIADVVRELDTRRWVAADFGRDSVSETPRVRVGCARRVVGPDQARLDV
ncbi:hypothetical protein, partial [Flindersiella endophytica]